MVLLRVYAGGQRLFRREPDVLPSKLFHGGVELRTGRAGPFQLVVAFIPRRPTCTCDWSPAISGRVGLEWRVGDRAITLPRLVTLMFEARSRVPRLTWSFSRTTFVPRRGTAFRPLTDRAINLEMLVSTA